MDVILLSLVFGALVGFTMGLTGGGGSLLAVPLLIYGLDVEPREAFGISLAVVGVTAFLGVAARLRAGEVNVRAGVVVAVSGVFGAPAGAWTSGLIADELLLVMFASLMLTVAAAMWRQSLKPRPTDAGRTAGLVPAVIDVAPGQIRQRTIEYALSLTGVGLTTGFLSGMFGVGGGFILVPALVFIAHATVHRAVATSLFVMVLVSVSGVASHAAAGRGISPTITGLFIPGGLVGMHFGSRLGRRLSPRMLQQILAVGIIAVAAVILFRSLRPPNSRTTRTSTPSARGVAVITVCPPSQFTACSRPRIPSP